MVSVDIYAVAKDILKYIKEKELRDPVLLEKVSELLSSTTTLRGEFLGIQKENADLKAKMDELTAQAELTASLTWDAVMGVYWRDVGGNKQAVCPRCMVDKGKPSPMQQWGQGWQCNACSKYVEPQNAVHQPASYTDF